MIDFTYVQALMIIFFVIRVAHILKRKLKLRIKKEEKKSALKKYIKYNI